MEQQPLGSPHSPNQQPKGNIESPQPAVGIEQNVQQPVSPEVGPAPAETVRNAPSAPVVPVVVSAPPTVEAVTLPAPAAQPAAKDPTTNPAYADDADVIEKEWVNRAKQIVLSTKDSPYQREREVGKLQADYLQKRYGKEIKLVED